jgi:hypothetical protein
MRAAAPPTRADLVAGHLAQGAPAPSGGDPQHQVVLHGAGEHRAEDDPDAAGQITHLGGQHRADEWSGSGDGGEMVAEQHAPVGRHVVGAVVENFGRRGVVVARANDLHLDQPGVEPEADDVGADRREHKPDRVHRLAAGERDDRPRDGTDDGDYPEHDLVPDGDRGAVDYRDGRQVFVGADVADRPLLGHGQTLRRRGTAGQCQYSKRTASMVSASAGLLSSRYRTTRANRSARPPG